jgi:type 1 glutamine amidotransferase
MLLKWQPIPATRRAMQNIRVLFSALVLTSFVFPFAAPAAEPAQQSQAKIRVLLVTGGHGFEKEPFFKLFKDNPDITYQAVEHPNAHALLTAEAAKQWDVLVLYDMHQEITPEAKADFVARLKEGKGLVVLHHAIADYQTWPEYTTIIGAHYYLAATNVNGVAKPRSGWKEGLHFRIHIADPNHPVTRGVTDFDTHDEAYKWFDVAEECHPLLTTDEPESNKVIAWAKTYGGARVVYMQCGHDHFAYENPNYQQILRQAIRWTARRD